MQINCKKWERQSCVNSWLVRVALWDCEKRDDQWGIAEEFWPKPYYTPQLDRILALKACWEEETLLQPWKTDFVSLFKGKNKTHNGGVNHEIMQKNREAARNHGCEDEVSALAPRFLQPSRVQNRKNVKDPSNMDNKCAVYLPGLQEQHTFTPQTSAVLHDKRLCGEKWCFTQHIGFLISQYRFFLHRR